ncbi:MAG: D-glycero-beta-D-manno-heptose-7-phosphate kinase [Deltaproteobacteria bacterium]|nr:D-glycero-beta-D-manno-heptose-7-phosphate kinase [Deltaproteobacteria bacterium]
MKEALKRLEQTRVLVVGDLMLDRYYWGDVSRISPEAPVPVVKVGREEVRLGGAANVVNNLTALGCKVGVCGLIGVDDSGREVKQMLTDRGVDTSLVFADSSRPTGVKLRVLAHHQQMLRCDWERVAPLGDAELKKILAGLEGVLDSYDGVIVSDYGKGLITRELMAGLVKLVSARGKLVTVDPKGMDYSKYKGAACMTPNEHEASLASHMPILSESDALKAGERLMKDCGLDMVCITRGAKGVMAIKAAGGHQLLPAQAREVFDVTGAGDTFISLFSGLLFGGVDFFDCVRWANLAAGIVVGKLGTATVSLSEILSYEESPFRLYTLQDIEELARSLHRQNKKIVFTNGCFDLLHAGHIQYLQESRKQGDVLIVGINSDESVRRLKGPARPVIQEEDRAHVLGALAAVDYVVIFEEDTPLDLIGKIQPDVLTKGADYTVDTVVGHDLVTGWGGEVRLINLKENRSTSGIIQKISSDRTS